MSGGVEVVKRAQTLESNPSLATYTGCVALDKLLRFSESVSPSAFLNNATYTSLGYED